MNSGLVKIAHGLGGVLVLIGAALYFFEFDFAKYVFAVGAGILILVNGQYLMDARNENIRVQRIVRMMFLVTLMLGVGAYLMFVRDDRWVILVLLYAIVSVFLAWRSGGAKQDALKK